MHELIDIENPSSRNVEYKKKTTLLQVLVPAMLTIAFKLRP